MNVKTKTSLFAAGILLTTVVNGFSQQSTDTFSDAAQESVTGTPGVASKRAVVNFSELARQEALARAKASPGGTASRPATPTSRGPIPRPSGGPVGRVMESLAPASSFLALLGEGEWADKPDSQGAVGPNHLMVALNTSVRIQDRAGGVISTVSLSNFWASLGPFNVLYIPEFDNYPWAAIFDPKLLYDPYANRFVFVTLANMGATNSSLLIGASQTSDPTGNWNLYRFDADANNQTYIDYPFMGFNKDWIAVQTTMFNISGDAFNRVHIYAFNKTNLYAGGNGAFRLFARSDLGSFLTPAMTYDTNLSTLYLIQQNGQFGSSINSLRLFTITGPVSSPVFTIGPTVTSTNFWAFTAPGGWNSNFFPQKGTTQKIYSKGANIQTLAYRNGSLWAAQTVYLPAGGAAKRSAVQWWQISPQGQIIQRGLIDDPTGVQFFAYPSLAVN